MDSHRVAVSVWIHTVAVSVHVHTVVLETHERDEPVARPAEVSHHAVVEAGAALHGRVALHVEQPAVEVRVVPDLTVGVSVITCPSPLKVLKYTYDHSCHLVRSD